MPQGFAISVSLSTLDIVALLPLLIWIYLLTGRGGFWRASRMTWSAQAPPKERARIAVVIPARDEAAGIGKSIVSVLAQQAQELHVYVVDDGSTDGTADVARAAAKDAGRSRDISIIVGEPLPPGWTGKLWAVQQGIERARELTPEFILLSDADIVHAPGSLGRLIALSRHGGYDLTSLMVRLSCVSAAERWLIPAFVFFFFMLYPPRWIANPRARTAGAAGGCMLLRAEVLARIGGVREIRAAMIDDCALARLIKSGGGKVWLGLADDSASLRGYGTAGEIGDMIARSAFSQLRHSALLLALTVVGLCICFLLPVALLFTRDWIAMSIGAAVWALMAGIYLPTVRYYRLSVWWALTLPSAALFYMGATLLSALRYWGDRGGQWKGRTQDIGSMPSSE